MKAPESDVFFQEFIHHGLEGLRLDAHEDRIPALANCLLPLGQNRLRLVLVRPDEFPDPLSVPSGREAVVNPESLFRTIDSRHALPPL
jgi:hypothetical protein